MTVWVIGCIIQTMDPKYHMSPKDHIGP